MTELVRTGALARYSTLDALIRDGMGMRLECRKCRHVERVDPEDARNHVAIVHRTNAYLNAHRAQPIAKGNPDQSLQGCVDGFPCRICRASDWQVDPIKPLKDDSEEGG